MLVFGHLGISFAVLYSLRKKIKQIDYRYLILGAIISDLIDKPLGLIILKGILYNGRLIAHTALFALLVALFAFYRKSIKLKLLSLGIWLHLIFDFMFLQPETFLWPLFGNFKPLDYKPNFIMQAAADPVTYASEIIGFAFLLCIFIRHKLYKKTKLLGFLKTGKLE
ncbi:MAG: metal-dependent hydrolase [Candidatus Aenigmarchaeota archaeon]|nr:metal-dependent hydrolase [Candidatus Aenigmarchaeota archaeon]MDI6722133.1 metal-dependent hydrolase [Candidatus Aenigmarchaeota archaeon]